MIIFLLQCDLFYSSVLGDHHICQQKYSSGGRKKVDFKTFPFLLSFEGYPITTLVEV